MCVYWKAKSHVLIRQFLIMNTALLLPVSRQGESCGLHAQENSMCVSWKAKSHVLIR